MTRILRLACLAVVFSAASLSAQSGPQPAPGRVAVRANVVRAETAFASVASVRHVLRTKTHPGKTRRTGVVWTRLEPHGSPEKRVTVNYLAN